MASWRVDKSEKKEEENYGWLYVKAFPWPTNGGVRVANDFPEVGRDFFYERPSFQLKPFWGLNRARVRQVCKLLEFFRESNEY